MNFYFLIAFSTMTAGGFSQRANVNVETICKAEAKVKVPHVLYYITGKQNIAIGSYGGWGYGTLTTEIAIGDGTVIEQESIAIGEAIPIENEWEKIEIVKCELHQPPQPPREPKPIAPEWAPRPPLPPKVWRHTAVDDEDRP